MSNIKTFNAFGIEEDIQGILRVDTGIVGSDGSATMIDYSGYSMTVPMEFAMSDKVLLFFRAGSGTSWRYPAEAANITLNVNNLGACRMRKGTTLLTTDTFRIDASKLYAVRPIGIGSPVPTYYWQLYEIASDAGALSSAELEALEALI